MKETLSPNTTLSHYRILAQLGAGGMGEVWLAEDTRLRRKVALKLLPAVLTADVDRVRRFEQEAQAASALSHPNIITVYDIGESDAGRFIVMELVAGRTLRTVIAEDNSVETLLALGQQMAKALSAAHAAGITHRDIKPDNIMVRDDGYVKVLDFGLARLRPATESDSEAATLAQQTTPGAVMGTVAYMSPEQARGEPVNHPSDIFALGIVLYELATGRHPFKAETLVGYLHAITLQEPLPLTQWKPELPAALNDLILQMLSKDARQRPTASEVARELQDIERRSTATIRSSGDGERASASDEAQTLLLKPTTTAATEAKDTAAENAQPTTPDKPKLQRWWIAALLSLVALAGGLLAYRSFAPSNQAIDSLAVLPFQNRSANADSEYLSDGLAESLIYRLSQLPDLKVSPTSSVFRYKGKETDPLTIGTELGLRAVMSGRLTQRGEHLTISVELVDVRNNKTLWGEQYERKLSELLTTQREIAAEITNKLQLKLSGEGAQKLTRKYTDNPEAYQLYLKGRYHWNKRTYEDLLKAIEQFKAAISKDADYALAYAGLADTYSIIPYYHGSKSGDYIQQARFYAQRGVELDDQLAETHTSLAFVSEKSWNWTEAEKHYQRAIELNPDYSTAQTRYARFEIRVPNRGTQALLRMKRALEIEPSSLVANDNLSQIFLLLGDADAALEQAKRTTDLDSQFAFGWLDLAYAQLKKGQYSDALASAAKVVEVSKRANRSLVCLGVVNAAIGRRGEAMAILKELEEKYRNDQADATEVAAIFAGLGDKDQAFVWLDKAFADHSSLLVDLRAEYPFAALRDDPRFKDLQKRMNLPE